MKVTMTKGPIWGRNHQDQTKRKKEKVESGKEKKKV